VGSIVGGAGGEIILESRHTGKWGGGENEVIGDAGPKTKKQRGKFLTPSGKKNHPRLNVGSKIKKTSQETSNGRRSVGGKPPVCYQ